MPVDIAISRFACLPNFPGLSSHDSVLAPVGTVSTARTRVPLFFLILPSPDHIADEGELLRWDWEGRDSKEPPFDDGPPQRLDPSAASPHPTL